MVGESSLSDASQAVQRCVRLLGQLRTHLSIGEIGIAREDYGAFGKQAATCFVQLVESLETSRKLMRCSEAGFRRALPGRKECCGQYAASYHEVALSVVAEAIQELSIAGITLSGRGRGSDPEEIARRLFHGGMKESESLASDMREFWPDIHDSMQAGFLRSVNDKSLLADVQSELAAAERCASKGIPVEHRTRVVTKAEAARLHAGHSVANPTDYLRRQISAGTLSPPVGAGKSWRFDIRQFPESARDKLR